MHHGAQVPTSTFQFKSLVLFFSEKNLLLVLSVLFPYGLVTSKEEVNRNS